MSNQEKAHFDNKINEQLVFRIKAGEDTAANMLLLWQQNHGFIVKMAMKYHGQTEVEDLIQEGYIGMCEAVSRFKPERGVPFISYAAFWIRQSMQRYVDNCSGVVRLPVHAREWIHKYYKAIGEYKKYHGVEPSDRELCGLLGVSKKKLQEIKKSVQMGNIQSLDEPLECQDLTLADTIASELDIEDGITRELDAEEMKRELWIAVDDLPGNLPDVIQRRYINRQTQKEISESLGVHISRIGQIERQALRILRRPENARKFRGYYEEYLSAYSFHHVGVQSFQRTWISEVEREALRNYGMENEKPFQI